MALTTRRSPKLAFGQAPTELRDSIAILEDLPRIPRKTPASSAADGFLGEVCQDDDYLYIRGSSAWKRIALSAF